MPRIRRDLGRRVVAIAATVLLLAAGGRARAEPPVGGAPKGLLAADPATRAAAARDTGKLAPEAFSGVVPDLVELLDDEDAGVRAAASDVLVRHASRAVPAVIADLAGLPPRADKPDMLSTFLLLAGGLTAQDFAVGVAVGTGAKDALTELDVKRAPTGIAVIPARFPDRTPAGRTKLRMLAYESARRPEPLRTSLARGLVMEAWEAVRDRLRSAQEPPALSPLSPEDAKRLAESLSDSASLEKRVLAADFVWRTGLGGDAVVPGLERLLRVGEAHLNEILTAETEALVPAAVALSVVGRGSAAAREVLQGLTTSTVEKVVYNLGRAGGAAPWGAWLDQAETAEARAGIAFAAVDAGFVDEKVVSTLKARVQSRAPALDAPLAPDFEAFEFGFPSSPSWSADALGRCGDKARDAVPLLEAYLRNSRNLPVAKVLSARALLRLRPGHPGAIADLAAEVGPHRGTGKGLSEDALDELWSHAMEGLADAGAEAALRAGMEAIEAQLADASGPPRWGRIRGLLAAARALAAAEREGAGRPVATLAKWLSPLPAGADGSAESLLKQPRVAFSAVPLRCAALDAVGRIGVAAKVPAVQTFLQSDDARLRHAAARALRRGGS